MGYIFDSLLLRWSVGLTVIFSIPAAADLMGPCTGYDGRFPEVACIDRFGSVMPLDFSRQVDLDHGEDKYSSTSVPNDASFTNLKNATFVVWDEERGTDLLGSDPVYELMFQTTYAHEAPVYIPDTNELWFSSVSNGFVAENIVDLNVSPPNLSQVTFDPPVYAPLGARYRDGKVYFAAAGGSPDIDGRAYRPGIYSVDPSTRKSTTLANNYFGYYFNSADDLDIDADGNIWFTDPLTSRNFGVNTEAPKIQTSTYRLNPTTGAINIVDDTLIFPNGISFSPDKKTLYMSDTAGGVGNIDPRITAAQAGGLTYNSTNPRTIYAFDVTNDGAHLTGRRPLYTAIEYVPDGLKVASNGYLITGAGFGVDILDAGGAPILRIQTPFISVNTAFAGTNLDELWIVGHGAVARVKINLSGIPL